MSNPLAGSQALHNGVNLALRPCHGAGSKFHRAGKHPKAHEVEEAATLVADTVEDGGETEKAFFLGGLRVTDKALFLCLHWICSNRE
jgi:hypothetical protein